MSRAALAAVVLAALAAPAAAEVRAFTVSGEGAASASDPRTAALDDAFAAAIRQAVAALVDDGDARAAATAIDREVIARARRWVASFKVTRDRTVDGRRVLEVVAQVDLAKLTAQLATIDVPVAVPAAPAVPPPRASGKRATLLLRVLADGSVRATFGAAGTTDVAGGSALGAELGRRGWTVVPASASGPAPRGEGDLPLGLDAARAFAGEARADVAVVVGITAGSPGPVRGSSALAVAARAHVAIVDARSTNAPTTVSATGGAYGADGAPLVTLAVERAALAALADAGLADAAGTRRSAPPPGEPPAADAGELLVTLRGGTWAQVTAAVATLAKRKGVKAAAVRRLAGDDVVVAVTTGEALATIAKAVRGLSGVRSADVDGDGVVAVLRR